MHGVTARGTTPSDVTWVAAGNADPRRLQSYRRLLASRAGETDQRDAPPDDELPPPRPERPAADYDELRPERPAATEDERPPD